MVSHAALFLWAVESLNMLAPYRPPSPEMQLIAPGDVESRAQRDERHREIAEAAVVAAETIRIPGLSVPNQLRVELSVGYFESGFHRSVGTGSRRGDGGKSWCYLQLNIGDGTVPLDGEMGTWKGKDLVSDPRKCFLAGVAVMKRSMTACASLPMLDRLSAYASGTCREDEPSGRDRMRFSFGKILGRPIREVQEGS